MLSIVLLLLAAWITLLIINATLIVVPISLGRALFNALPLLPITHGLKNNGKNFEYSYVCFAGTCLHECLVLCIIRYFL